MKILVVSPRNKPIVNFRGDLIKDMIKCGHSVFATGPDRAFYDEIMSLGIERFIEIPFVRDNTSVSGDIAYYRALKRCIKEVKPDLVFSYTPKPVIYGSLAASSERVKAIYSMCPGLGRTFSSKGVKGTAVRRIMKVLYRRAFKKCEKVIFQNPSDIKYLTEHGYLSGSKCCLVNGSGVNMDRFRRMPVSGKPSFLMISRIIKDKGIFEYIEAAKTVKKKYPESEFVLLGRFDTSIRGISREDLSEYINSGIIIAPGEVSDPIEYYERASVFVLPSYYNEGLPRTILEAMACGRPVITTDWPGCREPIDDGKNGILVPIKDSKALAEAMLTLIEDKELMKRLSDSAYKTCKEKYDVSIVNTQMREIMGY